MLGTKQEVTYSRWRFVSRALTSGRVRYSLFLLSSSFQEGSSFLLILRLDRKDSVLLLSFCRSCISLLALGSFLFSRSFSLFLAFTSGRELYSFCLSRDESFSQYSLSFFFPFSEDRYFLFASSTILLDFGLLLHSLAYSLYASTHSSHRHP